MQITTYDTATGEFGAVRTGPSLALLIATLREGQSFKEGGWNARFHRVDLVTGEIVEKSPT